MIVGIPPTTTRARPPRIPLEYDAANDVTAARPPPPVVPPWKNPHDDGLNTTETGSITPTLSTSSTPNAQTGAFCRPIATRKFFRSAVAQPFQIRFPLVVVRSHSAPAVLEPRMYISSVAVGENVGVPAAVYAPTAYDIRN